MIEWQAREPAAREGEKLLLLRLEILRERAAEECGLVIRIFHDAEAAEHSAIFDHALRDTADDLIERVVRERAVIDFRALVLAEADEHHLHQPALEFTFESRVRLHAVHHEHMVRLRRVAREMHGNTLRSRAEDDRLHARSNRASAKFLRDPIVREDAPLALRSAAAVAAHRRNDERQRADRFEMIHDRLDDEADVRNATAARGDGDGLSGPDAIPEAEPRQFASGLG